MMLLHPGTTFGGIEIGGSGFFLYILHITETCELYDSSFQRQIN